MAQKPLSTEQLQEAADAVEVYGSVNAAARALGIPCETLRSRYHRAQQAAKAATPVKRPIDGFEVRNISTEVDDDGRTTRQWIGERLEGRAGEIIPDGHIVKGLSTLVDESGKIRAQWVKTSRNEERLQEAIKGSLEAAARSAKPLKRIKAPRSALSDLLTMYTITDYHMGMLAWGRETGVPWDLAIAERVLMEVLGAMIDAAPASEVGMLNQLGDFLHFDSLKALTPEHGHLLDADSRYQKVVEVTARVLIWAVRRMLEKHKHVHVGMREGNHDMAGSIWLRVLFAQVFKDNPRVTVEQSPRPYVIYEWGNTLLGFHHGHLSKNEKLPMLFAALYREAWGRAKHAYIHTGHRHSVDEKEHPGVIVTQHPTLAAPDAYAARGGWISKRQAASIDYHKERGEVARRIHLPPE